MEKYLITIKKINYKYLAALSLGILSPFLYMWIRIYWIVDDGSATLATTSFQTYIQMFMEILGAFLLIPLLTYKKEEYNNKSLTIFTSVSMVLFVSFFCGILISNFLIKPIHELNPEESLKNIKLYLLFMTLTTILVVFEQFLVTEIIVDKNINKALLLALISIASKIIIDILFLSNISPFEFNVVLVSFSSFISTFLVIIVLLILYLFELIKNEKKNKQVVWKDLFLYYQRGLIPALELTIRNIFYSLVTLQIVLMLGDGDNWNAWNMGGFVYWMIIFKLTSVLEYHLLSEMINEDREYTKILARVYLLINMLVILIFGIILSLLYLPSVIGTETWLHKTIILSLANIPIMMIIGTQNIIKQRFISDNKYSYILMATLIGALILNLPLLIVIHSININFGFWDNYVIFGIGCVIPTLINTIQYIYIERKEKNVW